MAPPSAIRMIETGQRPAPGPIIVAMTAMAMPTMPYQMARFALSWLLSPPSERMKRTPATT